MFTSKIDCSVIKQKLYKMYTELITASLIIILKMTNNLSTMFDTIIISDEYIVRSKYLLGVLTS